MKFLVDAQLPKSLSRLLQELGYDSIHTLDLPDKNRSKDSKIAEISDYEERILITKDSDFLKSFVLKGQPSKLIVVKTGNIKNSELLKLFSTNMPKIYKLLGHGDLIEVTHAEIVLHK